MMTKQIIWNALFLTGSIFLLIYGLIVLPFFFGVWGIVMVWGLVALMLGSFISLGFYCIPGRIITSRPKLKRIYLASIVARLSGVGTIILVFIIIGMIAFQGYLTSLVNKDAPLASIGTTTIETTSPTPAPTVAPEKSTKNSDSQSSSSTTKKSEDKPKTKATPKPTVAPTAKPTQKPVVQCTPQPTIAPSATKPSQAFDASKIIDGDGQAWKLDKSSKILTWIGLEDGSCDIHQGSIELLSLIRKGYTFKFKTTVPGTIIISNGTINGFDYTDPSTSKRIAVSAGNFIITSPGNVGGFRWTPQQGYGWRK